MIEAALSCCSSKHLSEAYNICAGFAPFHSGLIVPALHSGALCDTCRTVQVIGRRWKPTASKPLSSDFCSLFLFLKRRQQKGFPLSPSFLCPWYWCILPLQTLPGQCDEDAPQKQNLWGVLRLGNTGKPSLTRCSSISYWEFWFVSWDLNSVWVIFFQNIILESSLVQIVSVSPAIVHIRLTDTAKPGRGKVDPSFLALSASPENPVKPWNALKILTFTPSPLKRKESIHKSIPYWFWLHFYPCCKIDNQKKTYDIWVVSKREMGSQGSPPSSRASPRGRRPRWRRGCQHAVHGGDGC